MLLLDANEDADVDDVDDFGFEAESLACGWWQKPQRRLTMELTVFNTDNSHRDDDSDWYTELHVVDGNPLHMYHETQKSVSCCMLHVTWLIEECYSDDDAYDAPQLQCAWCTRW